MIKNEEIIKKKLEIVKELADRYEQIQYVEDGYTNEALKFYISTLEELFIGLVRSKNKGEND